MNGRARHRRSILWLILVVLTTNVQDAFAQQSEPRSPRDEMATFVLAHPELSVSLVAAEPDVTSPVAIAWDENGRLYVAEMIDYPTAPDSGRIRCLQDRDGDGRYEHATIFADGLPFPNGVLPVHGGVLVTAAPNIWYLRDNDGDGRADERTIVLTGFGEGNTQLRVNGLAFGLDNRIYAANGRSDGEIRRPSDPASRAVSIRRRDLRFRVRMGKESLEAADLEAIAGFSQFGLAHDDWGNRFPSWNTIPVRHVVFEQQALDRNRHLAETSCIASILDAADGGRIYSISPAQARFNRESVAFFNASCGPLIERGGLLPDGLRGHVFVCEPLSNVIHHRTLEPDGVTFVSRRVEPGREFLASTDPAFRPVNLATGPDGALYVVDMYRELVEHPQFVPENARGAVDFRRWHNRGRIWRVAPRSAPAAVGARPDLGNASAAQLVGLLNDPNAWRRTTAQRLLVERADRGAVPLLVASLLDRTNTPLGRLHALWALAAFEEAGRALLERLLDDPHPALREHALRVAALSAAGTRGPSIAETRLLAMAADPAIRVRLQAALALGGRGRDDRAAQSAMADLAARDARDPWMRLAILSGQGDSAVHFIDACLRKNFSAGRAELLTQAAALVGAGRRPEELSGLLDLIVGAIEPTKRQAEPAAAADPLSLLAGLADGLERSGDGLGKLLATDSAEMRPRALRLASFWPTVATIAVSDHPAALRTLAIDVLASGHPDLVERIVPELLAGGQSREIESAAARAVGRSGRISLVEKVLDRWNALSPTTRRAVLSSLSGPHVAMAPLVTALEKGSISATELDASARAALERLPDPSLRQRATAILAKFAIPPRTDALARYQGSLKLSGDTVRGAAVFARVCQTCHQRQGQGHKVGPDLSGVAGRASDALLTDILDPNREVAPDYIALTLATHRGQVVSGLLAEETATSLKIRRAEGVDETILRSEIEELRSTGRSLMPEGLEQSISVVEMADLIAFLRQGT
jgi:putative membrane-bound dehydrogenase-like protein